MGRPGRRLTDALLVALAVAVVALAGYALQPAAPASSLVELASSPTAGATGHPTAPGAQATTTPPDRATGTTAGTVTGTPTGSPDPTGSTGVVVPATAAVLLVGADIGLPAFVDALRGELTIPTTGAATVPSAVEMAALPELPTMVVVQGPHGQDAAGRLDRELAAVRAADPQAQVVVFGRLRRSESGSAAVRAAATAAGVPYLAPLDEKWLISSVGAQLSRAQRDKVAHRLMQGLTPLLG